MEPPRSKKESKSTTKSAEYGKLREIMSSWIVYNASFADHDSYEASPLLSAPC